MTGEVETTTSFTYGREHCWEVGLNLSYTTLRYASRVVKVQGTGAEKSPHLNINLHKGVKLAEWWLASVSTRAGITYEGAVAPTTASNETFSLCRLRKRNKTGFFLFPCPDGSGG